MSSSSGPDLFQSSGVLAKCGLDALASLRNLWILLPLVPWILLKAGIVLWLSAFPAPPRDAWLTAVWEHAGGEAALHFPESYAALPRVSSWADPILELVLGLFALSMTVALLPSVFLRRELSLPAAWRVAVSRFPAAWLAGLPGIVLASIFLVLADSSGPDSPQRSIVRIGAALAVILARTLFAYVLPATILGGLSPRAAIRRSASFAIRHLWTTAGFIAFASVLVVPWRADPSQVAGLFETRAPEDLVPWIMAGGIPTAVSAYLRTAAATRLYLHSFGGEASP